jgi:phage I-like protein
MKIGKDMRITVFQGEPIGNGAFSGPNLPTRLKLLNWGANESTKGLVIVGLKTLSALPATQRELGFERVALDFEHNTVPGTRAYAESKEPRPVAAYGTVRVIEGEGLFFENLTWTPEGLASARNFEDLSPAVRQDDGGEVVFVHSAGLVRNGAVRGLTFFSVELSTTTTTKEAKGMKAWLLKLLNLKAEATDLEIEGACALAAPAFTALCALTPVQMAALTALSAMDAAKLTALSAMPIADLQQKLTILSAVSDSGKTTIEGLVTKIDGIEKTLTTLSAEKAQAARTSLLERAAREGKVVPLTAEQIEAMDLTVLTTLVDKLPATVPVSQRTIEDVRVHSATPRAGSQRAEIFRNCGLKDDEPKG